MRARPSFGQTEALTDELACPGKVFDLYDAGHTCSKTPDVNEIVQAPVLSKLPGCNPVFAGPGPATPCADANSPAIIPNPVAYTGKAP